MNGIIAALLLLTAGLAAANGANDVSKGVATLAGVGLTRYRTAVVWGVVATFVGSTLSLVLAARITTLFSKGIVTANPTDAFALAVLAGVVAWVVVATGARLPVSTTHAIVGALIGAGLVLAPTAVQWKALVLRVVIPLLASAAIAYFLSAMLNRLTSRSERLAVDMSPVFTSGPATAAATVMHSSSTPVVDAGHWVSSGATSFARGLNDTPKIVAIGSFGLVPGHLRLWQLLIVVALAMALGGLAAGIRVAKRLGENVIRMSHAEGFMGNLTTAVLVGVGANLGLPMSTTHVSTGAIAGIAGTEPKRLNGDTLCSFVLAWIITPAMAGLVAALVFLLLRSVMR